MECRLSAVDVIEGVMMLLMSTTVNGINCINSSIFRRVVLLVVEPSAASGREKMVLLKDQRVATPQSVELDERHSSF